MKVVKIIQLKIVIFTAVKNRCILHGRVFVMTQYTAVVSYWQKNKHLVLVNEASPGIVLLLFPLPLKQHGSGQNCVCKISKTFSSNCIM